MLFISPERTFSNFPFSYPTSYQIKNNLKRPAWITKGLFELPVVIFEITQKWITKERNLMSIIGNLKRDQKLVPGNYWRSLIILFKPSYGVSWIQRLYLQPFIKIKQGSGTSFWCTLCAHLFLEYFLLWYSLNWPSFSVRPSFLLKILKNLSFEIFQVRHNEVMNFQI